MKPKNGDTVVLRNSPWTVETDATQLERKIARIRAIGYALQTQRRLEIKK